MNQGTRWVLLMQKNRLRKSHAWAPLSFLYLTRQWLSSMQDRGGVMYRYVALIVEPLSRALFVRVTSSDARSRTCNGFFPARTSWNGFHRQRLVLIVVLATLMVSCHSPCNGFFPAEACNYNSFFKEEAYSSLGIGVLLAGAVSSSYNGFLLARASRSSL
jgi:hypothetical protein